jgi:CBS domain containing-hemolysin-like protein
VFDQLLRGERTKTLRDLMRPPLFVSEQTRGNELLEQFISRHQHLAVVTNEPGKMIGVVSLEDVLEYLLGRAIVAEHDSHPRMQRLARARARFHAEPGVDSMAVGPAAAAGTATTTQEAKAST